MAFDGNFHQFDPLPPGSPGGLLGCPEIFVGWGQMAGDSKDSSGHPWEVSSRNEIPHSAHLRSPNEPIHPNELTDFDSYSKWLINLHVSYHNGQILVVKSSSFDPLLGFAQRVPKD